MTAAQRDAALRTTIKVMMTTSLSNAKVHLSDYVKAAEDTHERTTITKNGKPAAVLISSDDFESILATVELLSDPDALANLEESKIGTKHGFYYAADEVWNGQRAYTDEESEQRLIERMGRDAYETARAAIRAELLAHPDANVRERAKDYQ